jgi:mannose-1-phosphate guanylyltransferase/mannose-6-phosphate isomerase
MTVITPIMLAGGSGTRLWPLSRKSYPKQFSSLIGNKSLFQESAIRVMSSEIVKFGEHITITHSDYRFIIEDQLNDVGIKPGTILIEPETRDTAPAILAASIYAMKNDKNAIVLVSPSDHIIPDQNAFHKVVASGLIEAEKGRIVTFGISPTHPETGYGYLELSAPSGSKPVALKRFIEKPDLISAKRFLRLGNYMWNAGIFLFRAKDMVQIFKEYAPSMLTSVKLSIKTGEHDLNFFRLGLEAWGHCETQSIDYAILEKTRNLVVVPFLGKWSDLGGWDAVWREQSGDKNNTVTSERATALNCKNVLLRSEDPNMQVVGLGLEDIIVVATRDAVLVAQKEHLQDVKSIVTDLKKRKIKQAETYPKDFRPWGSFETVALGNRFQVKKITVNPGASLSLQSHHHRSEHWVVVEGTAEVIVDNDVKIITEGQSIYIPLGAVHRLTNPGKVPMTVIEVQTGTYLGEDDIIRYSDIYSRA